MITATDLYDHLVEMPTSTGARTAAPQIAGNQSPKLQEPTPNCLVRNIDATLGQHVFDITKRQREPAIEPDRVLDDLRWKTMSLERKGSYADGICPCPLRPPT